MEKITISESIGEVSFLTNTPGKPSYVLLMAHGAGAGMHHVFMNELAATVAALAGCVIRYQFPYMEQKKKLPGSPKPNIETVGRVLQFARDRYPDLPIVLSGKSYGGRMSSHWVGENADGKAAALVYFGFPLHAPGKASKDRAGHLYDIGIPQLFIQGTRDALAQFDLIREVISGCKNGTLITIEEGDHSFKVPKKTTGLSSADVIRQIAHQTNDWILKKVIK